MNKNRIEWIDFGRGFTIFLVVVAHVLSGIYTNHIYPNSDGLLMFFGEFIFLFIMPVFFSLSGYFFKAPENMVDYVVMIKKKAWNILVPYVVFSFVYVLLNQLGGKSKEYSWGDLLKIWYQPISYLWFLYILFFIFILIGAFSLLKVQLLIYFIGFILVQTLKISVYIFNVFGWAVFFCLGLLFKKNLTWIKSKGILSASFVLSIFGYLLMIKFVGLSHAYFNDVSLVNFIPKVIFDILLFSFFLNINEESKLFKYFKQYGKYSLIIYMVHAPVLSAVRAIILKFTMPNVFVLMFFLLIIGWVSCLVVIWMNNRFRFVNFIFNAYANVKNLGK